MSFNHYAQKVRNPDLPPGTRVSALRSCIRLLSSLRNESFTQTINRFEKQFHFNWVRDAVSEPPPQENLIAALLAIETERNSLLEGMHTVAQNKRQQKTKNGRILQ